MYKCISKIVVLMVIILLAFSTNVRADSQNYRIIIEDDADLLTETEEAVLRNQMAQLTEFGNVMFKTTNSNTGYGKSLKYIQDYYYSQLRNNPGVAFYIDMNARQVCTCATGGLDSIVTNGKCDSIMDNVYKYATNKQYLKCAEETFKQINTLLNGGKIAESMKYICNAFVAIMFSLFVSYSIFSLFRNNKRATHQELIDECDVNLKYTPITVSQTGSHSVYSPVSDSSSGSSGRKQWWPEAEAFLEVEEATVFN